MADSPKESAELEDELSELPGRPLGPDEIDPELLKLSKPRTRVGWLLSLAVVVFCAYWMIQLRSDLAYSRQGDEPAAVDASDLDGLETDRYVSVKAKPDRARVARVHYGADIGSHVTPALGSNGQLWLVTSASAFAESELAGDVYAGRVKRMGDMPFYDVVREFFAALPVYEPLETKTAIAALAAGDNSIKTSHGDALAVGPDVAIEVVHRQAGLARIVARASANGYSDELSWRNALYRAGLIAQNQQPITGSTRGWTYEVRAPDGLEAIERVLEEKSLPDAAVIPVERVHTATWGQLKSRGSELQVGERTIPTNEITTVAVAHRPEVPADAVVLVASEKPGDYWYILWLYGLFGGFMLLFGWALVTAVRGSLPPTAVPTESAGEPAPEPAA